MTGEIKQNIQCNLENFASWLSQLSEEELKKIIYKKHNIKDDELDVQIKRKINDIVKEGHRDCLNVSKLLIEKGVYSYIIDEYKNGFDEDSEPVEWRESFGRFIPPEKFQSSIPCFRLESDNILVGENTKLMFDISNSCVAKGAIEQDKNINKYSLLYGNNPILLAISKGWNHINEDDYSKFCARLQEHINQGKSILPVYEENLEKKLYIRNGINTDRKKLNWLSGLSKQKDIISKLLEREDLDINCIHLSNGMTPLHIACLRGDSPELIRRLLDKRANPDAVNYKGEKPVDLLGYSYENTRKIIGNMTGGHKFESEAKYDENQSGVATLPTRKEREDNIKVIREILCTTKSRSDTPEGLSDQFHAQLDLKEKDEANKQFTHSTSLSMKTSNSQVNRLEKEYDNAKKAIAISTLVAITVMIPLSIYFIVQANLLAAGITAGCIIIAAVFYCNYHAKVDNKSPSGLLNDLKSGHESLIDKERNSIS